MKILHTLSVVALLALAGTALHACKANADVGHGHMTPKHWYPNECCHENDCAPALKVERVDTAIHHGRWVTSKHGRVWVPDKQEAHHRVKLVTDVEGKAIQNPDGSYKVEKIYTVPPQGEEGLHICMRPFNASLDKDELTDPETPMHILCVIQEPQG